MLFDFQKAFDVVNHAVLLHKLSHLGISGSVHRWIEGFLVGRTMVVSVSGVCSSVRAVKSGVPQGSVLGPLLFLIFINFLPASIICNCKIFADDLKIYLKVRRTPLLDTAADISACQRDIDTLVSVAGSWGLHLNVGKCVVLRFQRGFID